MGLPKNVTPEEVFSIDYFQKDPRPFFKRMQLFFPLIKEPSYSHYFQSLLLKKGKAKVIYSQNIDDLEEKAGVPLNKMVQGHGSVKTGHCMRCNKKYSFEWMKKTLETSEFLKCENKECDNEEGLVRPDIVMFGEKMPSEFFNYEKDLKDCDCLIVTGTSLKVHPFSNLPNSVSVDCPRILINRDLVGVWEESLKSPERNYRDVHLVGDCDSVYKKLSNLLNYNNELDKLIPKEKISSPAKLSSNPSAAKSRLTSGQRNSRSKSPVKKIK